MDELIFPAYLTYPEDPECTQWYYIEGKERIMELSRQLQTYLNYKKRIIFLVCNDSNFSSDSFKTNSIQKIEEHFLSILSQYIILIKRIGVKGKKIKEKIFDLKVKAISQPSCQEAILLKKIKQKGDDLWRILHNFSDLDNNVNPQVIKLSIETLVHLCDAESELSSIFTDFYQELRLNYQQLEREYEHYYIKIKNVEGNRKKYEKLEMIPE